MLYGQLSSILAFAIDPLVRTRTLITGTNSLYKNTIKPICTFLLYMHVYYYLSIILQTHKKAAL